MPFTSELKEKARIRSARRCCVCREYKGVGIEVHHIEPEAAGGPSTIENAIVLCFDCHAAAGHYNPKHPRGSKFSPTELKGLRDQFWAAVADGRVAPADPALVAGVHVRHLICLDYRIARQVLDGTFRNKSFSAEIILQTPVSRFMEQVLADDLPLLPSSLVRGGLVTPGRVGVDEYYRSRSELEFAHPEFAAGEERPVRQSDFDDGRIRSKLLAGCIAAGLPVADLGVLHTWYNQCGGGGFVLEYRLRRPLFVFTEVSNRSSESFVFSGVVGRGETKVDAAPRRLAASVGVTDRLQVPTIPMQPGDAILIPSAVLLSPSDEDDLSFEWLDDEKRGQAEVIYTGYADATARLGATEYLKVGSSFEASLFEIASSSGVAEVEARPFDIRRVYMIGQGWLAGSCPHAFAELTTGELVHLGEVLRDGWCARVTERWVMPATARRLHICEFELETTTLASVRIGNAPQLDAAVVLQRGQSISFELTGGDDVELVGSFDAALHHPRTSAQVRFKRSLVAGGIRQMMEAGRVPADW